MLSKSSMLKLITRTNTLALNTTLNNRMKLSDNPVCEACPYDGTVQILPALLTWMFGIRKYKRSKFSRNCWPYTCLYALSRFYRVVALAKTTILNWDTCYCFKQKCDEFFDRIGKSVLKRVYVWRSNVLNIDWNMF
jgi:hypothetical protein